MLPTSASAGHMHCRQCGREMSPGGTCPNCGWDPLQVATTWPMDPEPPGLLPNAPEPPKPAEPGSPSTAHRGRPPPAVHRLRVYREPREARGDRPPPPVQPVPAPAQPLPPPVAPRAPIVPAPRAPIAKPSPARRRFRPIDLWRRYLPPVRLVWIFLLGIAAAEGAFSSALQAGPILGILALSAVTDLGFQQIRFPRLRPPDAALATGLFVALIVWPSGLDLPLTAVTVASVGLRHVLRVASHPVFNPAAVGLSLATVLFGMTTSWHVGTTVVDSVAIAALGAVLVARAPHTYRLPVGFFAAFLPITVALTFALGGGRHWASLLEAGALGPASVFFGFFMATEPRTAPSARRAMWGYAIVVGAASAVLPVVFAEVPQVGALGVLAPFLALFVGNALTVVLPSARGARSTARAPSPRPIAGGTPTRSYGAP